MANIVVKDLPCCNVYPANTEQFMKELSHDELHNIKGGLVPLLIGAGLLLFCQKAY